MPSEVQCKLQLGHKSLIFFYNILNVTYVCIDRLSAYIPEIEGLHKNKIRGVGGWAGGPDW